MIFGAMNTQGVGYPIPHPSISNVNIWNCIIHGVGILLIGESVRRGLILVFEKLMEGYVGYKRYIWFTLQHCIIL